MGTRWALDRWRAAPNLATGAPCIRGVTAEALRPSPPEVPGCWGRVTSATPGGAVDHADLIPAWLRAEHQFVNDLVAVGGTLRNGDRAMVSAGYSVCDLGYGVGQLALLLRDTRS